MMKKRIFLLVVSSILSFVGAAIAEVVVTKPVFNIPGTPVSDFRAISENYILYVDLHANDLFLHDVNQLSQPDVKIATQVSYADVSGQLVAYSRWNMATAYHTAICQYDPATRTCPEIILQTASSIQATVKVNGKRVAWFVGQNIYTCVFDSLLQQCSPPQWIFSAPGSIYDLHILDNDQILWTQVVGSSKTEIRGINPSVSPLSFLVWSDPNPNIWGRVSGYSGRRIMIERDDYNPAPQPKQLILCEISSAGTCASSQAIPAPGSGSYLLSGQIIFYRDYDGVNGLWTLNAYDIISQTSSVLDGSGAISTGPKGVYGSRLVVKYPNPILGSSWPDIAYMDINYEHLRSYGSTSVNGNQNGRGITIWGNRTVVAGQSFDLEISSAAPNTQGVLLISTVPDVQGATPIPGISLYIGAPFAVVQPFQTDHIGSALINFPAVPAVASGLKFYLQVLAANTPQHGGNGMSASRPLEIDIQ
jgi:hypothetical protein